MYCHICDLCICHAVKKLSEHPLSVVISSFLPGVVLSSSRKVCNVEHHVCVLDTKSLASVSVLASHIKDAIDVGLASFVFSPSI